MTTRLNSLTAKHLPGKVITPQYDRNAHGTGIVHLGIGAFHRAHQAVYTDTAMGVNGGDWRIFGASLCNSCVRDQLAPQDHLFTVVEKTESLPRYRLVGSIGDVVFAPENPQQLLERMTDPGTRIVSLTITEKGYLHDPARGHLNPLDGAVLDDLKHPETPRTAIGYLVRALSKRRSAGIPPFTALSCDNLPENGYTLRNVVLDFAAMVDDGLAQWIERQVAFPCCMVDRIVPATTAEDRQAIENALDIRDDAVVVTEPFCQWVLEDCFPQGRPAWEKAGAIFSSDVRAFEKMKLRFLNGSHSTLAYLGYLAGKRSVAECMQWDALKTLVHTLMRQEIRPTVNIPAGYDINHYIDALIQRFANPGLHHRTRQIAMDGSQKLPQRLLDPIRDQLAGNRNIDILCLAVAGWMRYVCGVDEKNTMIEISDPMAHEFVSRTQNFRENPDETVDRLLSLTTIFGHDLPEQPYFCTRVKKTFHQLCTIGTRETIMRFLNHTVSAPRKKVPAESTS